jgi:hypothetical protein
MNLENIFVFAAATGRTLVLPPAAPLYLMNVSGPITVAFWAFFCPVVNTNIEIRNHKHSMIKRKSTKVLAISFL